MDHIQPLRLFDLARHSRFEITEEERKHLRECEECERILEVFARQFEKPLRPSQHKKGDAA